MKRYRCKCCGKICDTQLEEMVLITADMSGAELRIVAELADDPIWIGCFSRGEDVHSVGTELLHPEEWPKGTAEGCQYYAVRKSGPYEGHPAHEKCDCPIHKELRNDNKSTNFLLAYGGGPSTLAKRIKKTPEKASQLMAKHSQTFPKIWAYLEESGKRAKLLKKSFDMFGRRRLFPTPTWERATQWAKEDDQERWDRMRLPKEVINKRFEDFFTKYGRKPEGKITEIGSEAYCLSHREPTDKEIGHAFKAMQGSIERQGKNHSIQGTNATIAKLAMSCGFDRDGKPFLWHLFPKYKARLIKFVHDEFVVRVPKRFAQEVAALIGDAFKRAAAVKMKKVIMEFDYKVGPCWSK